MRKDIDAINEAYMRAVRGVLNEQFEKGETVSFGGKKYSVLGTNPRTGKVMVSKYGDPESSYYGEQDPADLRRSEEDEEGGLHVYETDTDLEREGMYFAQIGLGGKFYEVLYSFFSDTADPDVEEITEFVAPADWNEEEKGPIFDYRDEVETRPLQLNSPEAASVVKALQANQDSISSPRNVYGGRGPRPLA